jgi:flavin reductase (DIM6/NTAB) family NADH-FMN oxidoreductase RutF
MQHSIVDPANPYWGTPVVLITTTNPDLTSNIAPMSSAFWVGNRCILGLGTSSETTLNLVRTGECVLNLASGNMADAVNGLSHTTGTAKIPEYKIQRGYRNEKTNGPRRSLRPRHPRLCVRRGYANVSSRWKRQCDGSTT